MTHTISHSFSQNPPELTDAEKLRLLIDATSEKLATIDPRLTVVAPEQWGDLLDESILQALGNPTEAQLNSPIDETGMAQLIQMADEFMQSQPEDAQRLVDGFMNFAGGGQKPWYVYVGTILMIFYALSSSKAKINNNNDKINFEAAFEPSEVISGKVLDTMQSMIPKTDDLKEIMSSDSNKPKQKKKTSSEKPANN